MTEAIAIALIAAVPVTMGLLGGGLWRVITLILKTYKDQAAATVDAKDADLATKDAEITRLQDVVISELSGIKSEIAELRQDIWTMRRDGPQ